ncbi:MAG: hypothetical protein PHX78_06740 [bacterium]|nr:hypothetical protein [bacterium]
MKIYTNIFLKIVILIFLFSTNILANQAKSVSIKTDNVLEYKYKEGENLYYKKTLKADYKPYYLYRLYNGLFYLLRFGRIFPSLFKFSESTEGIQIFKVKEYKENESGWSMGNNIWQEPKRSHEGPYGAILSFTGELLSGPNDKSYIIKKNGAIIGNLHPDFHFFFITQPQFEQKIPLGNKWSKDVNMYNGVTAHYEILGEEIVKGKKCIIIETKIGEARDGSNDKESGIIRSASNKNEIWAQISLKGKSWFDPESGKIIKMETIKKIKHYNNQIKKASFELLSDEEVRKLESLENDWELVLSDVKSFKLIPHGKILFEKDAAENKILEIYGEVEQKSNYIWTSEMNGSGIKRLAEGIYPISSPDGKMVAYKKIVYLENNRIRNDELWLKEIEGEEKKLVNNLTNSFDYSTFWSPNGELLVFQRSKEAEEKYYYKGSEDSKTYFYYIGIYNTKTHELKDIKEKNSYAYKWLPRNNSFAYSVPDPEIYSTKPTKQKVERKAKRFIYNYNKNKSDEFNGMFSYNESIWSPNNLICINSKTTEQHIFEYTLTYFSPDYEIIKTELLNIINNNRNPVWSNNGKYIIFIGSGNKCKISLYSLSSQKVIWESEEFNFNDPKLSSDEKWLYFCKSSTITGEKSLYRIPTPKRLQELIAKGE